MQPIIECLIDKIKNTKIQTYPFDHLVVDNALPSVFYAQLAKELEREQFSDKYTRAPYGNKERYAVDITDYLAWKTSGRKILTTFHKSNYKSLQSGDSTNIKSFTELLVENQKSLYSALCSKLPTERIQDNYFFHANMTKDSVGYEIKPHPDDKENIYTILFYAPETDINKKFGLHVCGEKIEFIPNRMVIFAPSRPDSQRPATWHEVRRLTDELIGTRNSFQMFFYTNSN